MLITYFLCQLTCQSTDVMAYTLHEQLLQIYKAQRHADKTTYLLRMENCSGHADLSVPQSC